MCNFVEKLVEMIHWWRLFFACEKKTVKRSLIGHRRRSVAVKSRSSSGKNAWAKNQVSWKVKTHILVGTSKHSSS